MVPACPRCGYDLSGVMASWTLACPLETTCSECGLEIDLRWVLNARLRSEVEFFEAAQRRLRRAMFVTVRRAPRPWVFWRWVRMEYPPRPARMLVGATAGFVLMAASVLLVAGAVQFLPRLIDSLSGRTPRWNPFPMSDVWWGLGRFAMPWEFSYQNADTAGPLLAVAVFAQLLMPGVFLLLPRTLRRAKVRPGHLARVGVWSFVGLPVVIGAVELLAFGLEEIGWALSFVMPRASPFVPTRAEEIIGAVLEPLESKMDLIMPAAVLAWVVLWWGFAVGRYLKLPRAWLVTVVMAVVAVLATVVLGFLIPDVRYAVGLRF